MPHLHVNGTDIHYLDEGPKNAHAIVCSPSMFFDVNMFQAQAEALSDRYRFIRYDHRGQGASARAPRSQLDMETLTEDTAALIETLELGPCTFVGNSMGGFIALRLAARYPGLIRSIVAMGTSADTEEHTEAMDSVGELIARQGTSAVVEEVLPYMVGETTLNDPSRASVLAFARQTILEQGPESADALWHISHRKSILDELPQISCPTLLIAGTEDYSYPPEKSEQIKARITNAKIEYMEKTGHVHAIENPDAVIRSLEHHLAEIQA